MCLALLAALVQHWGLGGSTPQVIAEREWLLANPTKFGAGVKDFLAAHDAFDGACIAEAHVPSNHIEPERRRLLRQGWFADVAPSQLTIDPARPRAAERAGINAGEG